MKSTLQSLFLAVLLLSAPIFSPRLFASLLDAPPLQPTGGGAFPSCLAGEEVLRLVGNLRAASSENAPILNLYVSGPPALSGNARLPSSLAPYAQIALVNALAHQVNVMAMSEFKNVGDLQQVAAWLNMFQLEFVSYNNDRNQLANLQAGIVRARGDSKFSAAEVAAAEKDATTLEANLHLREEKLNGIFTRIVDKMPRDKTESPYLVLRTQVVIDDEQILVDNRVFEARPFFNIGKTDVEGGVSPGRQREMGKITITSALVNERDIFIPGTVATVCAMVEKTGNSRGLNLLINGSGLSYSSTANRQIGIQELCGQMTLIATAASFLGLWGIDVSRAVPGPGYDDGSNSRYYYDMLLAREGGSAILVTQLQRWLRGIGYLSVSNPPSGVLDAATATALRQFSASVGLPAEVDQPNFQTWRAVQNSFLDQKVGPRPRPYQNIPAFAVRFENCPLQLQSRLATLLANLVDIQHVRPVGDAEFVVEQLNTNLPELAKKIERAVLPYCTREARPVILPLETGTIIVRFGDLAGGVGVPPRPGPLPAITSPVVLKRVSPIYPYRLLRDGIDGQVDVVLNVEEDGSVSDVSVDHSSARDFERPAIDAVRKWKFAPATDIMGRPVARVMKLPIVFQIEKYN